METATAQSSQYLELYNKYKPFHLFIKQSESNQWIWKENDTMQVQKTIDGYVYKKHWTTIKIHLSPYITASKIYMESLYLFF